ncbi:unnamed protein product [Symbiodinium sp. KB8]|nr:unnamed protein product [Symbiodinium sp. KB8]
MDYLKLIGLVSFHERQPLEAEVLHCDCLESPESDESEDEDNILFSCEGLSIPTRWHCEFFRVDFSLQAYSPPTFAAEVFILADGRCLSADPWLSLEALEVRAVRAVLDSLVPLSDLTRDSFLTSTSLPPPLVGVPPAAALGQASPDCRVYQARLVTADCFVSLQEMVCCYFDLMCAELALMPADFQKLFSVTEVLPSVYSVHTESRLVLGSTFLRFQEYYECPDPVIRHSAFQFEEYKEWFRNSSRDRGEGFNYYLIWPGFNVPSWVVRDLKSGKVGLPLRPQEEALLGLLPETERNFYVIGTCEKDLLTLHHEMAHGLYTTNSIYRAAVTEALAHLPRVRYDASRRVLLGMGYVDDPEILKDEMQAYMVEGNCLYEDDEAECTAAAEVQRRISTLFRRTAGIDANCDKEP